MSNFIESQKEHDLEKVRTVIRDRFAGASFSYFYGSRANGIPDKNSDVDLIVVFNTLISPYREKFRYAEVLFDIFVYDIESLNASLHSARTGGSFVTIDAVISAVTLPASTSESRLLQEIAHRVRKIGYLFTHQSQVQQYITNILDDLEFCDDLSQQRMLSIDLYRTILEIILIELGEGLCSRKHAAKTIKKHDNRLAEKLEAALTEALSGNIVNLITIANDTLTRLGGCLREGFRSAIPSSGRIPLPVI